MKRVYAVFEDADDAAAATDALREQSLRPVEPSADNRFFDPTTDVPEARGWLWGGVVGGVMGGIVVAALNQYAFAIPRLIPIMTAGPLALAFLGIGIGAANGGFLGGVIGTYRGLPGDDRPRVVVDVADHSVDEVADRLRAHGASVIEDVAIYHDHPLREQVDDHGS